MAKRRILEKLKLTEISGVDRPCQEGAKVTIMKRAPDTLEVLEARLAKSRQQLVELNKKYNPDQKRDSDGKWTAGGGGPVVLGGDKPLPAGSTRRVARLALKDIINNASAGASMGAISGAVGSVFSGAALSSSIVGGAMLGAATGGAVAAVFAAPVVAAVGATRAIQMLSAYKEKRNQKKDGLSRKLTVKESNEAWARVGKNATSTFITELSTLSKEEQREFFNEIIDSLTEAEAEKVLSQIQQINKAFNIEPDAVTKFWSEEARRKAAEARRRKKKIKAEVKEEAWRNKQRRRANGQPRFRGAKALAISAVASPVLGAAYYYATRNKNYEKRLAELNKKFQAVLDKQ